MAALNLVLHEQFDADQGGSLDKGELHVMVQELGDFQMGMEEADEMFVRDPRCTMFCALCSAKGVEAK